MNSTIVGEFSESETSTRHISGGHRYTISSFSHVSKEAKKSLGSATFSVGGHKWQIVCYPGGEVPEVQDYVSLFLGYRGPGEQCCAKWRLTLINQVDPSKNSTRAWLKVDKFNMFNSGRRWGWQRFIRREDLLDPEAGFLKDNQIVFEASLDVHMKQRTTLRELSYYEPKLYPVPPKAVCADFEALFDACNRNKSLSDSHRIKRTHTDLASELADVRFILEDGKHDVIAHSQILSSRSAVLSAMFAHKFKETRAGKYPEGEKIEIGIADTSFVAFRAMIMFIYGGNVSWNSCVSFYEQKSRKRVPKSQLDETSIESEGSIGMCRKRIKNISPYGQDLATSSWFSNKSPPVGGEESEPWLDSEKVGEYEVRNADHSKYVLSFALELYQVADKYELHRLRLICEHKIANILSEDINELNCRLQREKFINKVSRSPGNTLLGADIPVEGDRTSVRKGDSERDKEVVENFIHVLLAADRHDSPKLLKICKSFLTSKEISKNTKQMLLSSPVVEEFHPKLLKELLTFLATKASSDDEEEYGTEENAFIKNVSFTSDPFGRPDGGNTATGNSRQRFISRETRTQTLYWPLNETTGMEDSDIKRELVERGYSSHGFRPAIADRLRKARTFMRGMYERGPY